MYMNPTWLRECWCWKSGLETNIDNLDLEYKRGSLDLVAARWELSSYSPVRVPGLEIGRDFWSVVVRGLFFVLLLYLLMKFILFRLAH